MARQGDPVEGNGGRRTPDFFSDDSLLAWIDAIYTDDGSAEALKRLARDLSEALGGAFVISHFMAAPRTPGGRTLTSAFDPRFEEVFLRLYPAGVPWIPLIISRPNQLLHVRDFFDEEAIRATPFYRKFMEPQGFLPLEVIGSYHVEGPGRPGFGWAVYGVRPFAPEELAFCRRLDPHLAVSARRTAELLSVRSALGATRQIADRSPFGLIDLDEQGRPTWMNRSMGRILAASHGIHLDDDRLHAERPEEQAQLEAAIRGLVEGDPQVHALAVTRGPARRPLGVLSVPRVGAGDLPVGDTRGALVFIDPDLAAAPPESLLRELYDLTPAEARLAVAIGAGQAPADVATRSDRSVETVRTQLKALFRKLGAKRQTDAARIVGAIGAFFPFEGDASED